MQIHFRHCITKKCLIFLISMVVIFHCKVFSTCRAVKVTCLVACSHAGHLYRMCLCHGLPDIREVQGHVRWQPRHVQSGVPGRPGRRPGLPRQPRLLSFGGERANPYLYSFTLELPPNSRLTVSQPEEAWSTKIVLVAKKKSTGEVTQSVTDKSLAAGLCGTSGCTSKRSPILHRPQIWLIIWNIAATLLGMQRLTGFTINRALKRHG